MSGLLTAARWRWLWRHRVMLTIGLIAVATTNGLLLLLPVLIGRAIAALPFVDGRLWILLILAFMGQSGAGFLSTYCLGIIAARAVIDLRQHLFSRLVNTTVSFYDRNWSAALMSSLSADALFVEQALGGLLPTLALNLPAAIGLGLMLLIQDWMLTLAFALTMIPLVIGISLIGRSLKRLAKTGQAQLAAMAVVAQESLGGIRAVKAMAQEAFMIRRFVDRTEDIFRTKRRRVLRQSMLEALLPIGIGTSLLVCGWVVQRARVDGRFTVEHLATYATYLVVLVFSLMRLARAYGNLEAIRGAASRITELIRVVAEVEDVRGQPVVRGPGAVAFKGVTFRYETGKGGVADIDLSVAPGEVVALVGANGAGKTTLLSLLLRFYQPQKGRIFLDGQAADTSDLHAWRRQFAVVTRDPTIFSVSVAENIGLGRSGATQAEIEQAARMVGLHEIIQQLPGGYGARVGEAGALLSSGQRQRLALARVFLQDPSVIVLDEATTSLDAESEAAFAEALRAWAGRRTVLLVAHRPHPGWPITRVVQMEAGRIVADHSAVPLAVA